MGAISILSIIATLVPTILQNSGVIGAGTTNLITALIGPIATMIANFQAGQTKSEDTLAVLGAAYGVLTVLEKQTGLPADKLAQVKGLLLDVQAALAEYVQSGKGIDLTVLAPIPLVV